MMRGSCRRIRRVLSTKDFENEYTLKILASFATFGLNNSYYYQEAEDLFIDGFTIYYDQHQDYDLLKSSIENFEQHLFKSLKNKKYLPYLNMAKHKIMISVNHKFAETLIEQLQKI